MHSTNKKFEDSLIEVEKTVGQEIFISGLVGPLRIFQRSTGHRHGIDDSTTAWYALQKSPKVTEALDLGTGVGTVGLAVLWGLGETAKLTCVEAQDVSYKLLSANIRCNDLQDRVTAIHADLRDLNLEKKFPLITGSPPYFPKNAGTLPKDSQKAHARFELRGHVGDYAKAAKRHLSDDGLFVFCFPARQKQRAFDLVCEQGFGIVTVRDVIPRSDKEPLFSLYSAKLNWKEDTIEEPALIVAGEDNLQTQEMLELQKSRGFGPDGTNSI